MTVKAVCVSNFHYYDHRLEYVDDYLTNVGYDVTYITTDYDTVVKAPIEVEMLNAVQIPVIHYKKNLSFERIYSHYRFGKDLYKQLELLQPQVVFAMAPPNFVAYFCAKYKKKYPHTQFILDIYDLWPETFPSIKAKRLLWVPFKIWGYLRDRSIRIADAVTTECFYYQQRLQHIFEVQQNKFVLYLSKKEHAGERFEKVANDTLNIAYLGSINNVTDIDLIVQLLKLLQEKKPTTLHVIATGENKQTLIERVRACGIEIKDYGKVFDEREKLAILTQCHFGLNIMKSTVAIGLTMKSIDYFHAALPIINTVQGDTGAFVAQDHVGVNVVDTNLEKTVAEIVEYATDSNALMQLKRNAFTLYQKSFTPTAIKNTVKTLFERLDI